MRHETIQPFACKGRRGIALGGSLFVAACAVLIGVPLVAVVWGWVAGPAEPLRSGESKSLVYLLLRSIGSAGTVAAIALVLAIGPAWHLKKMGWSGAPWLLIPMVAPSYLAYSGWQLLRSPGTWLGDWLESQTASSEMTAVVIGRAFAFGGSALWSWPLAMLLLAPSFRAIPDSVLMAMDMDGTSTWRKAFEVGRMARRGLVFAWVGVGLVMLGSAVPFHLAQVPTFAIDVWMTLVERPGDLGVWLRAWPLVVIAVGVAVALGRWSAQARAHEVGPSDTTYCQTSTWALGWTAVAWSASVVAPLGLFIGYLHSWSSVPTFLRNSSQAIAQNGVVAAVVGVGVSGLLVMAWMAAGSWNSSRRGLGVGLGMLVLGVILPGILVGSAVLRGIEGAGCVVPMFDALRDGVGALVWGHLARFGGIGALAGVVLAMAERKELREMRAIDGCGALVSVWEGLLRPWAGLVVGVGVAGGLLSMFEIESTILLVPPGPGSLSHTLLGFLHFAKDEQLSAAGVAIMGGGVVVAGVGAWVARLSLRKT